MKPQKPPAIADASIVRIMRQKPARHLYEGGDARGKPTGRWWFSHSGPDFSLTTEEVKDLEARGIIVLDFPGFYKLAECHR